MRHNMTAHVKQSLKPEAREDHPTYVRARDMAVTRCPPRQWYDHDHCRLQTVSARFQPVRVSASAPAHSVHFYFPFFTARLRCILSSVFALPFVLDVMLQRATEGD